MEQPACPECEKMRAVKEQSQAIGGFLEWLQYETEYTICERVGLRGTLYPASISIENLLAKFFDIDMNKVEEERRAILAYREEQNGRSNS